MRIMKWIGLLSAIAVLISCFMPWVYITSKNLLISGVETIGTDLGKPAYFHFFLVFLFIICSIVDRIWSKRLNLFFVAMNLAWGIRNYIITTACSGGECPVKKTGIYILLISSTAIFLSALFVDMKLKNNFKGPGSGLPV